MAIKNPFSIITVLFIFLFLLFISKNDYAQTIEVNHSSVSDAFSVGSASSSWNILDKLNEKDDELLKVPIFIGPREITYYENRISLITLKKEIETECIKRKGVWDKDVKVCKSITHKKLSDEERGFGLKLLNVKTGEVKVIAVKTRIDVNGVRIEASDSYKIEIAERPNGIKWNYWNTIYRVTAPENMIAIENIFPRETIVPVSKVVKGKVRKESKKVVQGFRYALYSEFFEKDISGDMLVEAGVRRDKLVVAQAFDTLRERRVKSKSFPDKLVADVEYLYPRFFERLVLLEQGDLTEFKLDPQKTVRRTLMILGANDESAYKYTCNRAGACGWIQFTDIKTRNKAGKLVDGTYTSVRKQSPLAQLNPNFKEGAGDQLNSMMAAILLCDSNLANLIKRYGSKIFGDPLLLQIAYAGSYNGSPRHVVTALDADLGKKIINWTKYLQKETHGFLFKFNYLVENDLP